VPTISVIIPTLNMASSLEVTLQSLNRQTMKPSEVIVADDLSTDSTPQICAQYGVKVVANTDREHWGISGGRNAAFSVSSGQFILPLDADDWIEPTYLEKTIYGGMTDRRAGIASTQMVYHGQKEGQIVGIREETYETELRANRITVASLIRREALEQAGPWDINLKGWEDWDMWLRILKNGWKHAAINEPLFHYRLHNTGMNTWANQNRDFLIGYLSKKHPGFMGI